MNDCARIEERIVDFLEDELSLESREEVSTHLARCPICRETARSYRGIREAYRGVPEADVSPATAGRILAAARAQRPRLRRSPRLVLLAAALLLAVLIPVVIVSLRRPADPVATLVHQGDEQRASGALEQAERSYEEALAAAGDEARAALVLHRLAALQVARGEFAPALERLNVVIARYPSYEARRDALLLQGEALEGLKLLDQAIQTYRLVASEFPAETSAVARRIDGLEDELEHTTLDTLRALGYVGE